MKIRIPATSANLGPGFDSLGLAIGLYNEAIITASPFSSISIKGEGSDRPKLKSNNAFVSIFHETFLDLTGEKKNFRFEFTNAVPLSRGLGSSSAVIVGAIASAYHMAGLKVDKKTVLNRALRYESHPDNITPAVYGGFTTSVVLGNEVHTQKKVLPEFLKAVVVIPDRAMSTAHSRTQLPKQYKMAEAVTNISHAAFMSAAFFNESWELLSIAAKDALHEDRRMQQLPALFDVRQVALEHGALMSTLSGSGSTFFNMVMQEETKNLVDALKKSFPDFRVEAFAFDNEGFFIENS